MKTIGIEIDKKRAICYAVEKTLAGDFKNITGKFKYLEIKDDQDNDELRVFQSTLFSFFDSIQSDQIAILSRQVKGKFAASPYSFKLEALIQCYEKTEVQFKSKPALNAFFKKNELTIDPDNIYQENALRLAYCLQLS